MKKNMGIFDRVLRIILAIVVAILIYMETLTGTAAIVMGIIAGIFLITSIFGICGLYSVVGVNTCKVK
jgi:uncharacterized membrane protein